MEFKISSTSLDPHEIRNFDSLGSGWWDPNGPFKPLHLLNPARLLFIRQQIEKYYGLCSDKLKPYKDRQILDVGCGGGLLTEPLTRNGAHVTGIDASYKAIQVAQHHAESQNLIITYERATAEEYASRQKKYDIVIASEIIEHVADVPNFINSLEALVKSQGLLIFTTLNRTYKSFCTAIIGAEYIMKILPRSTHKWKKFIKPSELAYLCRQSDLKVQDIQGMGLNLYLGKFELNKNVSVNYLLCAQKK